MTGSNSIPAGALRELGIPEHRIGASDIDFDFRHAAFHPKERTGGSNSPGARINLNSGILNPELFVPELGPEVATLWGKCLRNGDCPACS